MTFMGLAMSWAINPDSTLRKNSNDVWQLMCPALQRAVTRKSGSAVKDARHVNSRRIKSKLY
jgi:hypothetical protein